MGVHVGGLGDEVGGHLSLAEPVDYECDAEIFLVSYNEKIAVFVWAYGLTKREWRSDHF